MPRKYPCFVSAESVAEWIALGECSDGHLYHIAARNASLGVFCAEEQGFVISRHKFGRNYLFTEEHWDTGEPHGTAKPLVEIEEAPEVTLDYINQRSGELVDEGWAVLGT